MLVIARSLNFEHRSLFVKAFNFRRGIEKPLDFRLSEKQKPLEPIWMAGKVSQAELRPQAIAAPPPTRVSNRIISRSGCWPRARRLERKPQPFFEVLGNFESVHVNEELPAIPNLVQSEICIS